MRKAGAPSPLAVQAIQNAASAGQRVRDAVTAGVMREGIQSFSFSAGDNPSPPRSVPRREPERGDLAGDRYRLLAPKPPPVPSSSPPLLPPRPPPVLSSPPPDQPPRLSKRVSEEEIGLDEAETSQPIKRVKILEKTETPAVTVTETSNSKPEDESAEVRAEPARRAEESLAENPEKPADEPAENPRILPEFPRRIMIRRRSPVFYSASTPRRRKP
ncbi:hypothetical protein QBC46DRAFT_340643 [Diplogelasinospora grovesii]|uniref:Uncharacterized protein n=1 Tax=Diplogelasinospora grovesii TaxID=303347 RepID=A0AAN6NBN9_9PEZI|nr:hypothetical protein QBC46DRAFT_340643 [Diplogelasinospora grovesii]